jgi:hypothetical protein
MKYHLSGDITFFNKPNQFHQPITYVPRNSQDMTYQDYHVSIMDIFRNLNTIPNIFDTLPIEYYLYRGLGITNINSNNIYENYKPGDIIVNPTICSSSTELNVAAGFFTNSKPTNCGIFRILMKKNSKVLFINDPRSTRYYNFEFEVLLPPNCKFKVINLRYIKFKDIDASYNLPFKIINYNELEESQFLFIDVEYIDPDYITTDVQAATHIGSLQPIPISTSSTPNTPNTYVNLDFNIEDYINANEQIKINNDEGINLSNNNKTNLNNKNYDDEGINLSYNNKISTNTKIINSLINGRKILMKLLFDDELLKILKQKMEQDPKVNIDFEDEKLLNLINKINNIDNSLINNNNLLLNIIEYLKQKLYLNDISIMNDDETITYDLFKAIDLYNLLLEKFKNILNTKNNQSGGRKYNRSKKYKKGKNTKNIKKMKKNIITRKNNIQKNKYSKKKN